MLTVNRHSLSTGALLSSITSPAIECSASYRLMGGCVSASLSFHSLWGSDFVTDKTEFLQVLSNSEPVFCGRVTRVAPSIRQSVQEVALSGLWFKLDELKLMDLPKDKLTFGNVEGADHADITTAFATFDWLKTNKIVGASQCPVSSGLITAPSYPCKYGNGGFAIYANDSLTKVLETLATMEDCYCGVDAEGALYYLPRTSILAGEVLTLRVGGTPPINWKSDRQGLTLDGSFVEDRQLPTRISIASRDLALSQGTRTYDLVQTELPDARRLFKYSAPQIRTGQAARRLALGLFRRFFVPGLRIENLDLVSAVRRFEPHLFKASILDVDTEVASGLCGSVTVDWLQTYPKINVNLGETTEDLGSGNSLNDPLAETIVPDDLPQIDTGDSNSIDFDDGFAGDGDDLFQNPDRDDWTDPGGTVDYGTDVADPDNGGYGGDGSAASSIWKAIITAVAYASGVYSYGVTVYKPDGTTVQASHASGILAWPDPVTPYTVGVHVNVTYPSKSSTPYIIGPAGDSNPLDTVGQSFVETIMGSISI